MKTLLSLTLGGVAALSSAQTIGLASPSDWTFRYDGAYKFVAGTGGGGVVADPLGATVFAGLKLLQGSVGTAQTATLSQNGSSVATSALDFTATAPAGLLNGLGAFLTNALDAQDGAYSGTLNGTSLDLRRSSVATVTGTVDFRDRITGLGSVFDLTAAIDGSSLVGTADGVHFGKGDHVTGATGRSSTIAIGLGSRTYGLFGTTKVDPVQIGAIQVDANSWSLARAQAVPEPGSFAALGVGVAALARRRRKAA